MNRPREAGKARPRAANARISALTMLILAVVVAAAVVLAVVYSPHSKASETVDAPGAGGAAAVGATQPSTSGSATTQSGGAESATTGAAASTASTTGSSVTGSSMTGSGAAASSSSPQYSSAQLAALAKTLPVGAAAVHVPVLMYHYVDAEPPPAGPYADGLTVRTPDFEKEMDYLVQHGYHTVTLAEAYLAMAGVRKLPAKAVALTFDDGGLDNYTVAFPILKQRGLTATFFVITKTVGSKGQMGWDQLGEMAQAGMSIQSHTYSHPGLTGVSDARLRSELGDSRTTIEQELKQPVYVVAYPAGDYDTRVIKAAKAAGYVMGAATDHGQLLGPKSVFTFTRIRIQPFLSLTSFGKCVK